MHGEQKRGVPLADGSVREQDRVDGARHHFVGGNLLQAPVAVDPADDLADQVADVHGSHVAASGTLVMVAGRPTAPGSITDARVSAA